MRLKIDYGIYFNTDFCQIARMENGVPVIQKSDAMENSMPLCVGFNKRGDVLVGEVALNSSKAERVRGKANSNIFIEFAKTLGTSHTYESKNTGKSYSSEELLAECFKKLKSFVPDEVIKAVAITVPAKFLSPQLEAVRKAGKLAGFEQIELIQESIAVAMNFGLGISINGYYLIFDFQNEFKVSVCKSEDGINSVVDSEGDIWLGAKNVTEAIIDEIIFPYHQENYSLDFIFEDSNKKEILRNAVRYFAEEAKKQLSNKNSHNIFTDIGDMPFEDANGDEPKLDIEITQQDLAWVSRPIYQKAIDITIELLKRNNLRGKDLESICLVGEETMSPILHRMLKEQITDKVNTSVDPTTVVAKGAALFASTIPVSDEVEETTRDKTILQLDIKYEATTVELDEMFSIKLLKDRCKGIIPDKVYADIVRYDGSWSSGKKLIGEKATIIEVRLTEQPNNAFQIRTYNNFGNNIVCEPNQFTIHYGIEYLDGIQVLPYHIGMAKYFGVEGKELFMTIKGLEKNKRLPATGVINGFKTPIEIRPGIISDVIRFPIYQGNYNAKGTELKHNNHIIDLVISGESLPALLPARSDIDFTIKVDKSQFMTISAYIPYLNHTVELQIDIKQSEPIILKTIDDLKGELVMFYSDNPSMGKERFRFLLGELIRIEKNGVGEDEKIKVVDSVKNEFIKWK